MTRIRIPLDELETVLHAVLSAHRDLPWPESFSQELIAPAESEVELPAVVTLERPLLPDSNSPYLTDAAPHNGIRVYASRPLHRTIAKRLEYWMDAKCSPVRQADSVTEFPLLQDADATSEAVLQLEANVLIALQQMQSCWQYPEQRGVVVRSVLRVLGVRGIQRLLFMRRTLGSCYLTEANAIQLPAMSPYEKTRELVETTDSQQPSNDSTAAELELDVSADGDSPQPKQQPETSATLSAAATLEGHTASSKPKWSSQQHPIALLPCVTTLLTSFNRLHNPNAKLTVGARALTKHSPRDTTAGWWGTPTGTEMARNIHGMRVVSRILADATWINIHMLPHEIPVLEIRNSDSYGARWSIDGKTFRGFLEPHSKDGFLNGWKH
ncbi:hypothetical protein CAOG_06994 [Capsaspora owczarzaki ATCC 30864]|uniref:Uncharacterized protein n=1 Tax=Capsaspora owczarzaki (strain ATCC 30864) TaxID=595528 RepID=A0A0D2WW84_CAPO3|nr:hypothetical protein CAOG_06994 [Capsaspora owczarzaki ATCC 30864]KJE96718.1 hypothetical protein CAOG_006994 [Capsaspora owczarzaki ATCC 30864]|eukprot:XP_004343718.1 hypothetical protein CAOG_06994 [Capsaspora owczarzaki ATCC 30864]